MLGLSQDNTRHQWIHVSAPKNDKSNDYRQIIENYDGTCINVVSLE